MPVFIHEKTKQFHLQGKNVSYIFSCLQNGELGQLYFGKRIEDRDDFSHLIQTPGEPLGNATFPFEGDPFFSLEFLKQEYPSYGTSDYREPAFHIKQMSGNRVSRFTYQHYELVNGKPSLSGLPSTFVEDENEAETLIISLKDDRLQATIRLMYTVYHERDAIIRSASIINEGETLVLDRFLSSSVDFPTADYEWIHLDGAWIRERHVSVSPLHNGVQFIDSKRGTSSSIHQPFLALKDPKADEHQGEVYGFSLVYSGNFYGAIEVDSYHTARVLLGINPFDFEWRVDTGECFQSPEVVMVYSDTGLNGMSHTYHRLYEERLIRSTWKTMERPILVNNWEATYFDFHEEKLVDIAKTGESLGMELFVLDDGWFKGRNDDTTSLGDWVEDEKKLPNGLKGLGETVNQNGMMFGLWVEPEMISKESDLYRAHPDWVLGSGYGIMSHGRNQFMLDLTRQEVRNYLVETLTAVFQKAPIQYVKWDMNRNMSEIGSLSVENERQGEVAHRYVLGLYEVLEVLTDRFPHILFESCASGGNRFDPGMLHYMPQTWASDNTDAIERLKIQWGTSFIYPPSTIGAHVSTVANHQTGRTTPLETRFHVAMFGAFGYELDTTRFTDEEKRAVVEQINFYKENRTLLQYGTFYRLKSPFEGNETAWMTVDDKEAIVAYYRVLAEPNPGLVRIKLKGLKPRALYKIDDRTYLGDELLHIGLLLPPIYNGTVKLPSSTMVGDYQSKVWKLVEVDEGGK